MAIEKALVDEIVQEASYMKQMLEYQIKSGKLAREDYEKTFQDFHQELLEKIIDKDTTLNKYELASRMWTTCDWMKYKKIYDLHPSFANFLENTEDKPIELALLKRLPFTSFFVSFGKRKNDDKEWYGSIDTFDGMFVRVMLKRDSIDLGMHVFGAMEMDHAKKEWSGFSIAVPLIEGYNFKSESETNDRTIQWWKPFIRIALNTCQYLCASNAEIREVKTTKKEKPVIMLDRKPRPVTIERAEVGYRIGEKFEKMYAEASGEKVTSLRGKTWRQMRPHVRRAHWHHFWAGKGKQTLIVKWLEPIFVIGKSEEIDVVSHEVSGSDTANKVRQIESK